MGGRGGWGGAASRRSGEWEWWEGGRQCPVVDSTIAAQGRSEEGCSGRSLGLTSGPEGSRPCSARARGLPGRPSVPGFSPQDSLAGESPLVSSLAVAHLRASFRALVSLCALRRGSVADTLPAVAASSNVLPLPSAKSPVGSEPSPTSAIIPPPVGSSTVGLSSEWCHPAPTEVLVPGGTAGIRRTAVSGGTGTGGIPGGTRQGFTRPLYGGPGGGPGGGPRGGPRGGSRGGPGGPGTPDSRGGVPPGGPPRWTQVDLAHQHLSRLGELLNTLENVHPRGAPPGPPSGGVPGGVPGGVHFRG